MMKPKLWPVSDREVTQQPPEGLNFSSSKIIPGRWKLVRSELRGGRIIGTTIKAIVETTEVVRLQLPFGEETRGSRSSHQMLKACLALKYESPK